MSKYLIPLGSLTGDPIGMQRYMEVDEDDPSTAANSVIIYPDGRRIDTGTPQTSGDTFRFDWAGGLSELRGETSSVKLVHELRGK